MTIRRFAAVVVPFACICVCKALVPTVKNLRPVVPGSIYRSATLDNLSREDADCLLSGKAFGEQSPPLAAVIDLRNQDEIKKGTNVRTEGSESFYSSTGQCQFIHIPILEDVDAFWDEAIDRMDPLEKVSATLQTAFQGGALDRAAARNLEKGGHYMMYTIMMTTGKRPIEAALRACIEESKRGPVIFHCQKGKDRTGIVAMLLQSILEEDDELIVRDYALSGELLGEEQATPKEERSSGGMIDWNYFRGSPASAMVDTMEWTRQRYGSIGDYLGTTRVDEELLQCFREEMATQKVERRLNSQSD